MVGGCEVATYRGEVTTSLKYIFFRKYYKIVIFFSVDQVNGQDNHLGGVYRHPGRIKDYGCTGKYAII